MDKVLVVVHAFEDFKIGDLIIEDDAAASALAEEHRHKAVSVAVQPPAGHNVQEN